MRHAGRLVQACTSLQAPAASGLSREAAKARILHHHCTSWQACTSTGLYKPASLLGADTSLQACTACTDGTRTVYKPDSRLALCHQRMRAHVAQIVQASKPVPCWYKTASLLCIQARLKACKLHRAHVCVDGTVSREMARSWSPEAWHRCQGEPTPAKQRLGKFEVEESEGGGGTATAAPDRRGTRRRGVPRHSDAGAAPGSRGVGVMKMRNGRSCRLVTLKRLRFALSQAPLPQKSCGLYSAD